ncbi:MAG: hypothetical protein GQ564_09255 [Bacteroidales bacterium]|nr:hypothetical protein [Bacteroidales bacterium]
MRRFSYIFFVFLLVFSSCKTQQNEDLNLKHAKHIANAINNDLLLVRNNIFNTANVLQHKIPFDKNVQDFSKNIYRFSLNGTLVSNYIKSKSAIYYPANSILTNDLKRIIINSEALDTLFTSTIKKNPSLSQIYFIDTNSFLRIYPYIDVLSYLIPDINLKKFAPYQLANNKPFSEKAYWINNPIADPYGRGWIVSCVEPIYYRDHFIGILSGDITLNSLKEKYFSSGTELILIIDQKGNIICCTKGAGKITNIPHLRDFGYYKPITEDIYNFKKTNLTDHKNKSLSNAIKSLLSEESIENFYIDNSKYTIYKALIEETNWLLLKIIK